MADSKDLPRLKRVSQFQQLHEFLHSKFVIVQFQHISILSPQKQIEFPGRQGGVGVL